MNDQPDNTKPELQDAPPAANGHDAVEASDSGKPWIVGMVAAVMMAMGLVIGSMLWGAPKMTEHVEPFLQTVSAQQYAKAYGMVSQEWRQVMPQEQFVGLHTQIHKVLGDYVSMRQLDVEEQEDPLLGKIALVHFDAHFSNGGVELTAALRKTADGWALLDVQYVSPLIQGGPPAKEPAKKNGVPDFIHGPEKPVPTPALPQKPAAPKTPETSPAATPAPTPAPASAPAK